jgi:ABC-type antimicrobial peptide transport system permease subunit
MHVAPSSSIPASVLATPQSSSVRSDSLALACRPESPDWGTAIKDGSQYLRLYAWPPLVPAIALMSFVLGLNLLA